MAKENLCLENEGGRKIQKGNGKSERRDNSHHTEI